MNNRWLPALLPLPGIPDRQWWLTATKEAAPKKLQVVVRMIFSSLWLPRLNISFGLALNELVPVVHAQSRKVLFNPDGQRTSTLSIFVFLPRPKWTRVVDWLANPLPPF